MTPSFQSIATLAGILVVTTAAPTPELWDSGADPDGPLFIVYETFTGDAGMQINALQFVNQLTSMSSTTSAQVVTPAVGSLHVGWGSKALAVRAHLKGVVKKTPSRPVFVLDARDVLLNGNDLALADIMDRYTALKLAHKGSQSDTVVVSAEPQCCVTALSNQQPFTYFQSNGTRAERACQSGDQGCDKVGAYSAQWREYMTDVAPLDHRTGTKPSARYPNAGLVAGSAKAVLALYDDLDLTANEDDQAVLSEFFLRWPDRIILDYDQVLFGNTKWSDGDNGCHWEYNRNLGMMVHSNSAPGTPIVPAFLHFSNAFAMCYDKVASALGVAVTHKVVRVKQQRWRRSGGYYVTDAPSIPSGSPTAVGATHAPTAVPTMAPTTGTPAVMLDMVVSKPLTNFTSAEKASLKDGIRLFLVTTTSLIDSDILRVDLGSTSGSERRKRSSSISATVVLNESSGLTSSDASAAASAADSSNDTVSYTIGGQIEIASPTVSYVSIPVTGSPTSSPTIQPSLAPSPAPTLSPTLGTPPIEVDDDESMPASSIAAIIIFSLLAIIAIFAFTAYGKAELDRRQSAHSIDGPKSPRVSISEAFDEALPAQGPIEAEEWHAGKLPTADSATSKTPTPHSSIIMVESESTMV